ncbi:MAG: 4-hydroxythreonine-4-phosphate dehydrogenase PdxA [Sulfurimonas sp.]|nr:4-hydroxythreonine-4-phosphate dehydrogenase PdxA [Sulfurimonas sp.]
MLAGLEYKGHTDLLRQHFDAEAIMMLGCPEMFVALVTEHIPLREVTQK